MSLVDKVKSGAKRASVAILDLLTEATSGWDALEKEKKAHEENRLRLLALLGPPDEVSPKAERLIDATGDAWWQAHFPELIRAWNGGIQESSGAPGTAPTYELGAPKVADIIQYHLFDFAAACALLGPQMKANISQRIHQNAYEAGPPLTERLPLVEAIAKAIERIEKEQAQIADTAAAQGLPAFPLPPDEQARRTQRQQRHKVWEQNEALAQATRVAHGYPHEVAPEPPK